MKDWSLKKKLISMCILISLFTPLVGGISLHLSEKVFNEYGHIADVTLPNVSNVGSMDTAQSNVIRYLWKLTYVNPGPDRDKTMSQVNANIKNFEDNRKAYSELPFIEGEKEIYLRLEKAWNELLAEVNRVKELDKAAIGLIVNSPEFQAKIIASDKGLLELGNFLSDDAKARVKTSDEIKKNTMTTLVTVIAVALTFAIFLAIGFANILSKTLREIVIQLNDAGTQVTAAASEIASSSEELSHSSTEQAASLEQTAASIEEMNSMVSRNSENASQSAQSSAQSQSSAIKGKEVVQEMIQAIDEINESNARIMRQINESNEQITGIVHVISEIGNKTKIINDIVFQTKLLSFNASVEAARAGEHGKGFAVVAEEVGNLAQMSGNAAKEISSMLEGSINKVESIVRDTKEKVQRLVDDGKAKVEAGTKVANTCGVVLEEIVQGVSHVAQMCGEISSASAEQAQGVREITKAMNQLDVVTQQNASTSEEAASAAEELTAQAEALKSIVQNLVKTIDGGKKDEGHQKIPLAQAPKKEKESLEKNNVVRLKRKVSQEVRPLKKAAGAEPSWDDEGFKDI